MANDQSLGTYRPPTTGLGGYPFRPSPLARHIQDDDALEIYSELESEYAHNG